MIQLVYGSTAVKPFSPDALHALLLRARLRNTNDGLTGMLLHIDGAFLQVLEGEPDAVQRRFISIAGDHRHHQLLLLLIRDIAERNFPAAPMGFFEASGRGVTIPGHRRHAGFADLVGDPTKVVDVVASFGDGRWRSIAV